MLLSLSSAAISSFDSRQPNAPAHMHTHHQQSLLVFSLVACHTHSRSSCHRLLLHVSCVTDHASCLLLLDLVLDSHDCFLEAEAVQYGRRLSSLAVGIELEFGSEGGCERPTCSLFCLACILGTRNGHSTLTDGPINSHLHRRTT